MERLEQQMAFIKEIDGLKKIGRQTYIKDGSRKENDAEHSWHLAIMAFVLKEYANEEIDVLRVILMVLVHDIIELDAGDTYAYDEAGNTTKRERELKAAERIFHILPDDQAVYFRGLWDEFEEWETMEAKYAHTLDNLQPMMLNDATNGKSWEEHKVKLSQILQRNAKTASGSETLWQYAGKELLEPNLEAGKIIDDRMDD